MVCNGVTMSYLEHKYINLISSRLRNFKRKSGQLYNFSCPFCGDSERHQRKARGYIFEVADQKLVYKCHKCGVAMSVATLLKRLDPALHDQYRMELLADQKVDNDQGYIPVKPIVIADNYLKGLKSIDQLDEYDPIRTYVEGRKIPEKFHKQLFSCPNYMTFINQWLPNKFSEQALAYDETRLLIPFYDKENNVFGCQGRSLDVKSKTKYITAIFDDSKPSIFGLDRADLSKTIYVFEGPIDSMFIDNAVATLGGDLTSAFKGLPRDSVIVYDNEPRSRTTLLKIQKAIDMGFRVALFPESIEQTDINKMILAGLTPEYITYILQTHTYDSLTARAQLLQWRKI